MVFRELTMDDMKDKLTMTGSLFDVLLATAERAMEIEEREKPRQIKTLPPKNTVISRDRIMITPAAPPPRFPHHNGGGVKLERGSSSSSASNKRKRSPPSSSASKKRKIKPPKKTDKYGPLPPPPLPEAVERAIEEMARGRRSSTPAKLVIQKMLSSTDMSHSHNRLSIPMSMVRADFLKEEEKRYLRCYEGCNKKFMEVTLIEPSLAMETVKFCRWDMEKKGGGKTSSAYIINGTWNAVARRNRFRPDIFVQLWSFRLDEELCFALVRLPPHDLDTSSSSSSSHSISGELAN